MSNLVILGGSGYIGRHLVYTAQKDQNFRVYSTSRSGNEGNIKLILENEKDFALSGFKGQTTFFFLAGISSPDTCSKDPTRANLVNSVSTKRLIERILSQRHRVIFFSSDTIYGNSPREKDESSDTNPFGDYAELKHQVERDFLSHPNFKTVRVSYVHSSNDSFSEYAKRCWREKTPLKIYPDFKRAVVSIKDVVSGALRLVIHWNEMTTSIINFCGPEVISRLTHAEILKRELYPNLSIEMMSEAESELFFLNRPREINLKSLYFSKLLGREPEKVSRTTLSKYPSENQGGI